MKQDKLKQAYRSWFAQLDEEVPEEVWPGIEDELDLDEIWAGIDEELHPAASLFPWKWLGRVAAVLLLLISSLFAYKYIFNPGTSPAERRIAGQPGGRPDSGAGLNLPGSSDVSSLTEDERSKELPVPDTGARDTSIVASVPAGVPARTRSKPSSPGTIVLSSEHITEAMKEGAAKTHPHILPAIASIKTSGNNPIPLPQSTPEALLPENLLPSLRTLPKDPPAAAANDPFVRLSELGMVSAYNNTWMLNHETFNGLEATTLNATSAAYGISAGANASFLIAGRHKVGAELYLTSRTGQRYHQYIEALYQSRNIKLDYYKLQLYYQLPIFSGLGDVLAGGYASYLKTGREEIAGETRSIGRFYRDIDYGLMAGYQFNLPAGSRLQLHPGIRVNYGLPNIFKGSESVPGDFLRTHNASLGLYLGISYQFPR